jgi:hypothetical protein
VKPEAFFLFIFLLVAMSAAMPAVATALYGLSRFFVPDHAPDCQRHNSCDDQTNNDCSKHLFSSLIGRNSR